MNTNILKSAVCAAALLTISAPAFAQEDGPISFSGTVTLTTDYVFRGISQTQGDAAIQGDVTINHTSGLFGTIWASNVDFDDGAEDTNLEVDFTIGYNHEVNDRFSFGVGGIYYAYPDADDDYNYFEAYFAPSYALPMGDGDRTLTISGGLYYSPEFFGDTGNAWYITGGLALNVTEAITVDANIGNQSIDDGDDYTDWNIGVNFAHEPWGLSFDLRYTDTDIDGGVCANDICDSRVVLSVSKAL